MLDPVHLSMIITFRQECCKVYVSSVITTPPAEARCCYNSISNAKSGVSNVSQRKGGGSRNNQEVADGVHLQVEAAESAYQQYVQRVLEFMDQYDLLCCPGVLAGPFDVDIRYATSTV